MDNTQFALLLQHLRDLIDQVADLTQAVEALEQPLITIAETCDPETMIEQMKEMMSAFTPPTQQPQDKRSGYDHYLDLPNP